jgi:ABC-type amino acid transport substrate-binding protein
MLRSLLLLLLLGATAAFAQGNTLDKIRKSGTVNLGYRLDAVPFSFEGQDQRPAGFSVDVCQRVVAGLARSLKLPSLKTNWIKVTSESRLDDVASGKVDLECGTTSVTLGRQEKVDFSLVTFLDGGAFLARGGAAQPKSGAELPKARVAVSAGTTTEKELRRLIADNGTGTEVVTVHNHVEGVNLLIEGKVAMYAADRTILIGLAMNAGRAAPLQLLDMQFSYEPYALAMRRDADFRLAVNRVMAEMFREREMLEIYGRWFGKFGPPADLLRALYVIQAFRE